jgi:hypothetical protein
MKGKEQTFLNRYFPRWWWMCVPYTLLFSASVLIVRPSPFFLAHAGLLLVMLFDLTLWGSVAWTLLACCLFISDRAIDRTAAQKVEVALSVLACIIGVYLRFFWTGNANS